MAKAKKKTAKKTTKKAAPKKTTAKKTTKKAAPKKAAAKKATSMLLVTSKTKEALKSSGLNVSGETLEALNVVVHEMIAKAQERCVANGRKTIRPADL